MMPQPQKPEPKQPSKWVPGVLPAAPSSLREFLVSLAVMAGLVIIATVFSGPKSAPERVPPDDQETWDHFKLVPGGEILTKKLGPRMLHVHYAAFCDLYKRGAFGEKSAYFMDGVFVRAYGRLAVPDEADKFLGIMESARARMASPRYVGKSPNYAFRVAAGVEFLGEMQQDCPGCSKDSLRRIALQRSDALIDSCLR